MNKDLKSEIDLDIRFFRRYVKKADFIVHIKDKPYTAKTIDYSFNGLGIFLEDSPPIKPGDIIALDINELNIHQKGRVLWTSKLHSGLRVGISKTGLLSGSFKNYQLSDILIGLQRTLKTGILDIQQGSINKKVYIKNGNMIFAKSNQDKDRLGDILLKNRKISKEQYARAAERKRKTGERYAAILVDSGFLKPAELISAIELQAKRIIGSLFILRDAEFEFKEGDFPSEDALALRLSAANLIYRELKKTANVRLLEEYLMDSVVDFSPNPLNLFQDIKLNRTDKAIMSFVDGKMSIKDIIRLSSRDTADPLKIICALLEARILEIKKKGEAPHGISHEEIFEKFNEPIHELADKIEDMYSKYKNLDYYSVLGLNERATYEEIKKAYYRAAKNFHPDLHLRLQPDMKEKLLEIFIYFTNAYLTLKDPEERKEYDRCLQLHQTKIAKDTKATEEITIFEKNVIRKEIDSFFKIDHSRLAKNSEIALSKSTEGKTEFTKKNYEEAANLFAMAIYFDRSKPEYHYFYGYTLEMLGKLKESVRSLQVAFEINPSDPDILAELGHVYLKLGFPLRAKGYFDKALKLNPSHTRAKEGLKILKNI